MVTASRELAKWLPWAAALSFAAFVSAGAYTMFASDFRTMFPVALGLCIAIGVPVAVRSRGGGWWMNRLLVVVGWLGPLLGVVLLVGWIHPFAAGEGARFTAAMKLSFLPLAFYAVLFFLLMAAPFGLLAWLAVRFVLRLSREREALVDGVSILDLPGARLRVGLLLFVTALPPAVYLLVLLT